MTKTINKNRLRVGHVLANGLTITEKPHFNPDWNKLVIVGRHDGGPVGKYGIARAGKIEVIAK